MPTTNIRVPDELWKAVKKVAEAEYTSANSIVCKALEEYLSKIRLKGSAGLRKKRLTALIGIVKGGPPDLAENHDLYLRGIK